MSIGFSSTDGGGKLAASRQPGNKLVRVFEEKPPAWFGKAGN
jgi:hypothetical protein